MHARLTGKPKIALLTFDELVDALSPIAWWRLDEPSGATAADSVGALDGTAAGTYTRGASSIRTGSTASTTFTSGYVAISSGTSLDYAAGVPYAVAAWVQPTSASGGAVRQSIFNNLNNSAFGYSNFGLWLGPSAGSLYSSMGVTESGSNIMSSAGDGDALSLNTPHLVIGSFDGTYFDVHVDGVRKAHVNKGGSLVAVSTTGGSHIGGDAANPNSYKFIGQISDVIVFDNAISEAQALSLYQAGTA